MATENEVETLELVQKLKKTAKSRKVDVAHYLSNGKEKYLSAIRTMVSVGALTTFTSSLILFKAVFDLTSFVANNWGMPIADYSPLILHILEIAVFIVTIALGSNLASLNATPRFALISLIIILVANGLLAFGLFPLITVILAIIGLVRWSTYKTWFFSIDKKRRTIVGKKGLAKTAKSSNAIAPKKTVDMWVFVTSLTIAVLVAIGCSIGLYFLGKAQGYDSGKEEGYYSGYRTGESQGYDVGESNGYNNGYNNGYQNGYDKGYEDMWNRAMCIINGGGGSC